MANVTVLKPFYFDGRTVEKDEVIDMPDHAIRVYEKIDLVNREDALQPVAPEQAPTTAPEPAAEQPA